MKIKNLEIKVITKTFDRPQWNPRTVWTEKNVLLVLLETDTGIVGVGEGWCDGSAPASTADVIRHDFAPLVIDSDPFLREQLWAQMFQKTIVSAKSGIMFAAISAIDIALWDIVGKACGQPVYRLLGGASDRVFAYASAGLYGQGKSLQALADEMAGYVAKGYRAVKIKIGGAPIQEDIARVRAVREASGPEIRLMVDALYALTVPDAIKMAKALEPYDIHFLEAPVSPYDIQGLARVQAVNSVAVAGNEFAYGRHAFRNLIEQGAVSYVHLDAILCGGISEAMKIAAIASAWHLPCSMHAASSAVCFAANLHAAAAIANCDSIEDHMIHRMLFEHLPPAHFQLEQGYIKLPSAPGLGFNNDFYAHF